MMREWSTGGQAGHVQEGRVFETCVGHILHVGNIVLLLSSRNNIVLCSKFNQIADRNTMDSLHCDLNCNMNDNPGHLVLLLITISSFEQAPSSKHENVGIWSGIVTT
jgi:hypothetical protein